jgi:predicted nucleic acid-binding protein
MSGFLLDTNVPSELIRIKPDPNVTRWLRVADDETLYLSVISIGEIAKGLTVHPEEHRRAALRQWLDETLRPWFAGRILPVTEAISERWGVFEGQCQLNGVALSPPDGLIAATAPEHGLTIVTRNVKDFAGLGVDVLNPWE